MNNSYFLDIAENLKPNLIESIVYPISEIEIGSDKNCLHGWKVNKIGEIDNLKERSFDSNESFIVDFGDHNVGYLNLKINSTGSPQDAPLRLKLTLGEVPCEIAEPHENYNGWISRSWLQEEIINIDILPCNLTLTRRYAFRYLKIEVIATSQKYNVQFEEISCTAVTSANTCNITPLPESLDKDLIEIDRVAIKTLQDCMHLVFEDGPKRDRRLWIGDLRLQALANYYSIKNYDLVKRCLYLFAGLPEDNGQIGACLFLEPKLLVDDTVLFDYSLFFVSILHDYYLETKDESTLNDLWPTALKQIELALSRVDKTGIVKDTEDWWNFTDWHPDLNKQTPAQAVLIYTMKQGKVLSEILNDEYSTKYLEENIKFTSNAALEYLFDKEKGLFISGKEKQISWASQAWMVLAEVFNKDENAKLLDRLFKVNPKINMITPYMYHHLIEALIISDKKEKALELIRSYWGEMLKDGADCFWELYNPENKFESPYGSNLINSYCHAWSCTPTYFIRKYFI